MSFHYDNAISLVTALANAVLDDYNNSVREGADTAQLSAAVSVDQARSQYLQAAASFQIARELGNIAEAIAKRNA